MKKSSFEKLPREIWLSIVELAITSSLIPDEILDYSNPTRLNEHLRSSRSLPPIENSWARLRLVSREFHALAGASPYLYMHRHKSVNHGVRWVSITGERDVASCMRLLAGRPTAYKIATLSVNYAWPPGNQRHNSRQDDVPLDIMPYLSALSNLRSLTITLPGTNWKAFWEPLNDACPNLTCLVLICRPNAASVASRPVLFKQLKILDLDHIVPIGVEFPALRHLASGKLSNGQLEVIKKWPGLESLLFRGADHDVTFDWKDFPDLRVLTVNDAKLSILSRCPRHQPLIHVSVYVRGPYPDYSIQLVEGNLERLPTVNRLIIDPKTISEYIHSNLVRQCASVGLQLGDSPCGIIQRGGLFARSLASLWITQSVISTLETARLIILVPLAVIMLHLVGRPK